MKTILKTLVVIVMLFTIGCSSDDTTITPTQNTNEFFKYSINGELERVFDVSAKGYHVANTGSASQKFTFRAITETQSGNAFGVDGDFTFTDFSTFTMNNTFNWGNSDGITNNFYFNEITLGGFNFFPHPANMPSNPIVCTVTNHATNVGDYLEFTFSGDYIDAFDSSGQTVGTVSGSARILRTADQ